MNSHEVKRMTLENKGVEVFKRKSKIPSSFKNPLTFGRELRMADRIYDNSDRDFQAFMRKTMLSRMNESEAMLKSPQYTTEEKKIIKSNSLAMKDLWDRWNEELAVYKT